MRIAITGASGFLASNLIVRLRERGLENLVSIPHEANEAEIIRLLDGVEFVYHLAGVNRPQTESEFEEGNAGFTRKLCEAMAAAGKPPSVAYASSIKAGQENPYGLSKKQAEDILIDYGQKTQAIVSIYRLPNLFGKWCRPNYNSVVATFCYNISKGLPVTVHDPAAPLHLLYIDDAVNSLISGLKNKGGDCFKDISPVYETTVGALSELIKKLHVDRANLKVEHVGKGLTRALYSTYLSYLSPEAFTYQIKAHDDPRGRFVEMLKTPDCGQFSYFIANPGVTRGGHYHHSKVEKYLIIKGTGKFTFRNLKTDEYYELIVDGATSQIVETVPGWAHDITNIGDEELIVMLWANEVFDPENPDTIAANIKR